MHLEWTGILTQPNTGYELFHYKSSHYYIWGQTFNVYFNPKDLSDREIIDEWSVFIYFDSSECVFGRLAGYNLQTVGLPFNIKIVS